MKRKLKWLLFDIRHKLLMTKDRITCLLIGHSLDSFYLNPKYLIRFNNRKTKFKANEKIIFCDRCHKEWGTGIIKQ